MHWINFIRNNKICYNNLIYNYYLDCVPLTLVHFPDKNTVDKTKTLPGKKIWTGMTNLRDFY